MNHMKTAKEFLHSNEINEWDSVFDPGGKQEYTEEQLIRFAEIWEEKSCNWYEKNGLGWKFVKIGLKE